MKHIFTIALLLAAIAGMGQPITPVWRLGPNSSILGTYLPCGTWEKQPEVISEWVTVDTLGNKKIVRCFCALDSLRRWVYDEERQDMSVLSTDLVWEPCGKEPHESYTQYRVCSLTGIRQRRTRTIPYKYIEPPKSDYERLVDSLNAAWFNEHTIKSLSWSSDTISLISTTGRVYKIPDSVTWNPLYVVRTGRKRPDKITCSCPCHDGKPGFYHCFTDCCRWPRAPRISPKKPKK